MIIDTHAHLNFVDFKEDLPEVLRRARENSVLKIINIGCNIKTSEEVVDFANEYEEFYAAVGVHPYDAPQVSDELFVKWANLIENNPKIVAIGECGLDYFKSKVPKEIQKEAFKRQILFAQKMGLPLIVHNREADRDCFDILKEFNSSQNPDRVKVVFHCYGSDLAFAKELWLEGYYTSFTGIVTFPSAKNLHDVVLEVPLDKFMVETDAPYLAPQSHRGDRNESFYVLDVLKEVSKLKGVDFEKIKECAYNNSLIFFDRI